MADEARAPGMSSSCWRDVDAGDAGFFVSYLDRAAGALRQARFQLAAALQVRPGCSVLDVGSGVGEFLIEQAIAFPGIRAVGSMRARR